MASWRTHDSKVRRLDEVWYIPNFRLNLILLSRLDSNGYRWITGDGILKVMYSDRVILEGKKSKRILQPSREPSMSWSFRSHSEPSARWSSRWRWIGHKKGDSKGWEATSQSEVPIAIRDFSEQIFGQSEHSPWWRWDRAAWLDFHICPSMRQQACPRIWGWDRSQALRDRWRPNIELR